MSWLLLGAALSAPASGADFNRDGRADILWRHGVTGRNALWFMNGATLVGGMYIPAVSDTKWRIVGVADFNADGQADILWRHSVSGQNAIWLMNGVTLTGGVSITTLSDVAWDVVAVEDFTGDGAADILWRHSGTGQTALWLMNGPTVTSGGYTSAMADANWRIAGVADFNRDGRADIFWRHSVSGQNVIWFMNGATVASVVSPPTLSGAAWEVVGVDDFNGDGTADILWRQAVSGQNALWFMNGATVTSGAYTTALTDTNWRVAHVADFNGDGRADIFWRHSVTGQNAMWFMNGAVVSSGQLTTALTDLNWFVAPPALAKPGSTPDRTPNPFSFTPQTGVPLSTVVTSNAVTPTGYDAPTTITVSGGSYSINGGPFVTSPGSINPGQTVAVRQTSAGSFNTQLCATLTIGGVPGQFCATTLARVTVTLTPTSDNLLMINSLDSSTATRVFASGELAVGCNWAYSLLTGLQSFVCAESLMKFNLATLAGKTIDSATLVLTTNYVGVGFFPRTWHVRALATAWSGSTVTWNIAQNFQYYVASNINFLPPTFTGQTYQIDLKATVQAWANGSFANNGLTFGSNDYSFPFATSFDTFAFYSSEAGTVSWRPALVVTYH